jgi:hypothetical protein
MSRDGTVRAPSSSTVKLPPRKNATSASSRLHRRRPTSICAELRVLAVVTRVRGGGDFWDGGGGASNFATASTLMVSSVFDR